MGQKKYSEICFRPGLENIGGNGPDSLFGQRQDGRLFSLSFLDGEFSHGKGDMVEGESADFNGSESQAIGQVGQGIRPDIQRRFKFQASEEFLHLLGPKEFGWLLMGKQGWTYQQGGEIFPDNLFFIQIPSRIPAEVTGKSGVLLWLPQTCP